MAKKWCEAKDCQGISPQRFLAIVRKKKEHGKSQRLKLCGHCLRAYREQKIVETCAEVLVGDSTLTEAELKRKQRREGDETQTRGKE